MAEEHILEFEVRDYECDYQGVVNNAVYQSYLEHARHLATKQHFSVPQLSQQGIDLVVAQIQLRYLQPLRPAERFAVHSSFTLRGQFRLIFQQHITKLKDDSSHRDKVLEAEVCVAALENGRPCPFSRVTEVCGYSFA